MLHVSKVELHILQKRLPDQESPALDRIACSNDVVDEGMCLSCHACEATDVVAQTTESAKKTAVPLPAELPPIIPGMQGGVRQADPAIF